MEQFERLRQTYALIDGLPDHVVDLKSVIVTYGKSLDCGTIACAAGWLGLSPLGRSVGLYVSEEEILELSGADYELDMYDALRIALKLPTWWDARKLFVNRYFSEYDQNVGHLSDRQVFLHRVRCFLAER